MKVETFDFQLDMFYEQQQLFFHNFVQKTTEKPLNYFQNKSS